MKLLYTTLLLLLLALQPALCEPADRVAIPIRTPRVETPVETAGSGLAPEVPVRVHVDRRGRVTKVEVREVRPSSEFDPLFRQATEETLSDWRYAPAIRGGQPVEALLEWTIQFPSRETPQEKAPGSRPSGSSGQARTNYWDRVRRMKDEARLELLEESGRLAQQHLLTTDRRAQASNHFLVYNDSTDPQIAAKLAGNFEATYDVLNSLLAPVIDPQPERFKILAFVYRSRNSYQALLRDVMNQDWADGFYHPTGMLAIHLEMPDNEALLSIMVHEATHAYLDRHVIRRGVRFPRWLNEGFAEYVGNSTIKKGKLIPGRTTRSRIYDTPYGAQMGSSGSAFTIADVKQAIKRNEALSVPELIDASTDLFYGDRRRMYYSMSWLLVHYLRHGQPGWEENEFPTLMLYVAEGYPVAQVFDAVYGNTPAEMDPAYREYVKQF